jgi:hypothetical protein
MARAGPVGLQPCMRLGCMQPSVPDPTVHTPPTGDGQRTAARVLARDGVDRGLTEGRRGDGSKVGEW